MSLGKLPRTGITRILDGADVRERLLSIPVTHQDHLSIETAKIPDRVLVRRAEVKRSCSQLAMDVLPDLQTMVLKSAPRCGLTYIPRGVSLKTTKRHADPALRSWDFVVRCAKPGDCIPFLIRLQGTDDQLSASTKAVVQANSLDTPTFRAGQEANVMWDQGNLRFLLPGTVLDNGKEGDPVRVRLKAGRIVSAKITNSGIYLLPGEFGVRGSDNAR